MKRVKCNTLTTLRLCHSNAFTLQPQKSVVGKRAFQLLPCCIGL